MNAELMNDLHLMLGRVNALHAAVCVIASSLPQAAAQAAEAKLRESSERIQADALALPISDVQIQEMQRVLAELIVVLGHAHQAHQ